MIQRRKRKLVDQAMIDEFRGTYEGLGLDKMSDEQIKDCLENNRSIEQVEKSIERLESEKSRIIRSISKGWY